jgi:hypothetical protein
VYLDARELRGFDARVRQSWLDVVLFERTRIERVIIATPGVFISARAASLALKPLGVHLDVVSNDDDFEALIDSCGTEGAVVRAA